MTGVIIAGVLGLAALLAVGIVLGRQSSRQKKQAIASLEAEREALGQHSILDLVNEEVEELGLRHIEGAEDAGPDILLRAWRDAPEAVRAMDRGRLRFVPLEHDDGEGHGLVLESMDALAAEPDEAPGDAESDDV